MTNTYCPNCGTSIPEDAAFCPGCGRLAPVAEPVAQAPLGALDPERPRALTPASIVERARTETSRDGAVEESVSVIEPAERPPRPVPGGRLLAGIIGSVLVLGAIGYTAFSLNRPPDPLPSQRAAAAPATTTPSPTASALPTLAGTAAPTGTPYATPRATFRPRPTEQLAPVVRRASTPTPPPTPTKSPMATPSTTVGPGPASAGVIITAPPPGSTVKTGGTGTVAGRFEKLPANRTLWVGIALGSAGETIFPQGRATLDRKKGAWRLDGVRYGVPRDAGGQPDLGGAFRVVALECDPAADAVLQAYKDSVGVRAEPAPPMPAGAQVVAEVVLSTGGGQAATPGATPTPTGTPSSTPARTPTPTPSPSPTPPPTPTPSPTPLPEQPGMELVTLYVDGTGQGYTGVNVRARPTTESEKVGELSNGAVVQAVSPPIIGEDGQQWYQVQFDGEPRYVLASLLSGQQPETPLPPDDSGTVTLYVDAADQGYTGANVRERPTTEARFLGLLRNGDSVQAEPDTLTGEDGQQWYSVRFRGQRAYVLASLLSEQAP